MRVFLTFFVCSLGWWLKTPNCSRTLPQHRVASASPALGLWGRGRRARDATFPLCVLEGSVRNVPLGLLPRRRDVIVGRTSGASSQRASLLRVYISQERTSPQDKAARAEATQGSVVAPSWGSVAQYLPSRRTFTLILILSSSTVPLCSSIAWPSSGSL